MKDGEDINILFIQMVESLPALYNHKLNEYSNRNHQKKLWREIAAKFGGTVNECKLRWQNFRACYTRHLKDKNKIGPGANLRRPYYLAENLKFLEPFTKTRTHHAYLTVPSPPNDKFEANLCAHEPAKETNATKEEDSSNSNFTEHFKTPKKKRNSIDLEDTDKAGLELPIRKKQSEVNEEHLDVCFLKSMLSDMKSMNSDQKRRFKVGILNLSGTILSEKVAPMSMNRSNLNSADHRNFLSSSDLHSRF